VCRRCCNFGGGIENEGTLTISGSAVSGNSALAGGGIYNYAGTLTISGSRGHGVSFLFFWRDRGGSSLFDLLADGLLTEKSPQGCAETGSSWSSRSSM
jgi:hypothetical protein